MLAHKELRRFLITELNYSTRQANMVAADLLASQPHVWRAFEQWRTTGDLPDLEAEGYSLRSLVEELCLNPIGALLTLDWLLVEPEAAKSAIQEGYDIVEIVSGTTASDGENKC